MSKSFVILRASSIIWLLALWLIFIWNDKIQYEKQGKSWNKVVRSSLSDWNRNLATIVEWSPYASEEDLLKQVSLLYWFYFLKKSLLFWFQFLYISIGLWLVIIFMINFKNFIMYLAYFYFHFGCVCAYGNDNWLSFMIILLKLVILYIIILFSLACVCLCKWNLKNGQFEF